METSLNVYDYPEPKEDKVKTIKGKVCFIYKFETEVPSNWDISDILEDVYENKDIYQQDLDDIDLDI
jgi:hypothetical protein